MSSQWLQVCLYVLINVPPATHRELWKPARSSDTFLQARGASVGRRDKSSGAFDLTRPMWLAGPTPHHSPWVDLKEPSDSLLTDEQGFHPGGLNAPIGERESLISSPLAGSAPNKSVWVDLKEPRDAPLTDAHGFHPAGLNAPNGVKQRLTPVQRVPGRPLRSDKKKHEYLYKFTGQMTSGGKPCRGATVVLRLAASAMNEVQKVTTHSDGRYSFEVSFDGMNNDPLMWWLQGSTLQSQSRELEGSRILSHDKPRVSIVNDIALQE